MKKISGILRKIFALSAVLLLLIGGATFFGFLAALVSGGDTGEAICVFIYKWVFGALIYSSSITTLIGLLCIYFNKDRYMTFS